MGSSCTGSFNVTQCPGHVRTLTSSDQVGERVGRGCGDHTASLVLGDCYYNIVLVERLLVVHRIKGSFRSVRGRHDTCQAARARVNNEVPQKVDKTNSCKIVASEITADCALRTTGY